MLLKGTVILLLSTAALCGGNAEGINASCQRVQGLVNEALQFIQLLPANEAQWQNAGRLPLEAYQQAVALVDVADKMLGTKECQDLSAIEGAHYMLEDGKRKLQEAYSFIVTGAKASAHKEVQDVLEEVQDAQSFLKNGDAKSGSAPQPSQQDMKHNGWGSTLAGVMNSLKVRLHRAMPLRARKALHRAGILARRAAREIAQWWQRKLQQEEL